MVIPIPQEILDTLTSEQRTQLAMIQRYLEKLEAASSMEICACAWVTHPLDLEKPVGSRRMVRTAVDHPLCPTHTREGLIFYFLNQWDSLTLSEVIAS